jgi:hypothetical protein
MNFFAEVMTLKMTSTSNYLILSLQPFKMADVYISETGATFELIGGFG